MPRAMAATRFASLSYPLSVTAMRGRMSGPMSRDVSNCVLSLTSPRVRWKSRGRPSRSVLRWILSKIRRASSPVPGDAAPFCASRRDVSACSRAIEELDQMRRLAEFRQHLKERLEYTRPAEPPETLPHAVPVAEFFGQCTPGYALYPEIVDCLQEFTVIMPRLSPVRLRSVENFQLISQSCSVIPVSMSGSLMPVTQ